MSYVNMRYRTFYGRRLKENITIDLPYDASSVQQAESKKEEIMLGLEDILKGSEEDIKIDITYEFLKSNLRIDIYHNIDPFLMGFLILGLDSYLSRIKNTEN